MEKLDRKRLGGSYLSLSLSPDRLLARVLFFHGTRLAEDTITPATMFALAVFKQYYNHHEQPWRTTEIPAVEQAAIYRTISIYFIDRGLAHGRGRKIESRGKTRADHAAPRWNEFAKRSRVTVNLHWLHISLGPLPCCQGCSRCAAPLFLSSLSSYPRSSWGQTVQRLNACEGRVRNRGGRCGIRETRDLFESKVLA